MKKQSGVFLLEALVAILIFAFGALGMLAMSSAAITGQGDAQVRTDAASYAEQLAGEITLNVDRTSATTLAASLAPFVLNADASTIVGRCPYQAIPNAANATYPAANTIIQNWITAVTNTGTFANPNKGLPGATAASLSVNVVSTPAGAPTQNAVTITECWQGPADHAPRKFVTIVYVDY